MVKLIYYFASEQYVLKIISFVFDLMNEDIKLTRDGTLIEGNKGKLIRKYVQRIGAQNILKVLNNLKNTDKKVTLKVIEKEFIKIESNIIEELGQ